MGLKTAYFKLRSIYRANSHSNVKIHNVLWLIMYCDMYIQDMLKCVLVSVCVTVFLVILVKNIYILDQKWLKCPGAVLVVDHLCVWMVCFSNLRQSKDRITGDEGRISTALKHQTCSSQMLKIFQSDSSRKCYVNVPVMMSSRAPSFPSRTCGFTCLFFSSAIRSIWGILGIIGP